MNCIAIPVLATAPFVILLAAILIISQIFLSKNPRRYLGIILPILTFAASIAICLYFVLSVPVGKLYTITLTNGEMHTFSTIEEMEEYKGTVDPQTIQSEESISDDAESPSAATYLQPILRLGAGINIITVVLLLIYRSNRHIRRLKQDTDIQKMTIQELK